MWAVHKHISLLQSARISVLFRADLLSVCLSRSLCVPVCVYVGHTGGKYSMCYGAFLINSRWVLKLKRRTRGRAGKLPNYAENGIIYANQIIYIMTNWYCLRPNSFHHSFNRRQNYRWLWIVKLSNWSVWTTKETPAAPFSPFLNQVNYVLRAFVYQLEAWLELQKVHNPRLKIPEHCKAGGLNLKNVLVLSKPERKSD